MGLSTRSQYFLLLGISVGYDRTVCHTIEPSSRSRLFRDGTRGVKGPTRLESPTSHTTSLVGSPLLILLGQNNTLTFST